MPAGLPVAMTLLAMAGSQPAAYGPPSPAPARAEAKAAAERCSPPAPGPGQREIVICAQRPQGYRLDPDVTEAKRELRSGGRPTPPERYRDSNCSTIGPMGCRFVPTINLVSAAMTAVAMAERALHGGNVGQMFVTDPHPTEYQLYVAAKRRRQAEALGQAERAWARAPQEVAAPR